MDENFKTLLFLVCTVSLSMVVFNVLQWLTRVEGKLNLNLIRNSALRVEQYYRMREEIEKEENNKERLELIDRLIEWEADLGLGKEEFDKIAKLSRGKNGNKEN